MNNILIALNMTMFQFIMNCILILGLLISGIWYVTIKKKPISEKKQKKNKVETRAEISRRKQEDDELTSIMNAANSDDLYTD